LNAGRRNSLSLVNGKSLTPNGVVARNWPAPSVWLPERNALKVARSSRRTSRGLSGNSAPGVPERIA
jgi:hypothetical protein